MAIDDQNLEDVAQETQMHAGNDKELPRKKKRKLREAEDSDPLDMGQNLSSLRQPDISEFNLTSASLASQCLQLEAEEDSTSQEWQKVENGRPAKKAKKIPKPESAQYPSITFSNDARLQTMAKISDLQNLALYILADGSSPQFVSVKHRPQIRKVVVLMIPGLEESMFFPRRIKTSEDSTSGSTLLDRLEASPDNYYPHRLDADKLPTSLRHFADMFSHLWPVKTPGDDRYSKMHSPLHAMLTVPAKQDKKRKGAQKVREPPGWTNKRTPIHDFLHAPEVLAENDYTLHPVAFENDFDKQYLAQQRAKEGTSIEHGWVDTAILNANEGTPPDNEIESGSITAGREILAIDCEMCMTGEKEFSLTRISVVNWHGTVVLDELVKPDKPITDYVTM